jgi:hypothetical protein
MVLHLEHRAFSRSEAGRQSEKAAFFQGLDSSFMCFIVTIRVKVNTTGHYRPFIGHYRPFIGHFSWLERLHHG